MNLKKLVSLLGAFLDVLITTQALFGHLVLKPILAIRALLYTSQAVFLMLEHGHSKASNLLYSYCC